MAASMRENELVRSMSKKASFGSASRKGSWASASIRDAFDAPGVDVFAKSGRQDDEDELKWAAIERLPTYDRMRKEILKQVLDNGKVVHEQVDVAHMGMQEKKQLMESILNGIDEDNERFLLRLKDRIER